jgi:hypothetical protein
MGAVVWRNNYQCAWVIPSGGSLAIQAGTALQNNGSFVQFAFDMTGYRDLEVSYATRGTSTGFDFSDMVLEH